MVKRLLLLVILAGCSMYSSQSDQNTIVSMQLLDRNGFSETISSVERLAHFQKAEFLSAQPYQKVLRIFGKDREGRTTSKVTSYHPNGEVFQYLEVTDGRAHGQYREWHLNGTLKVEATIIEGIADVGEAAQASWLFDQTSYVWNEEGRLVAEIRYDKGVLEGPSTYYHPNGTIERLVPYRKGTKEGEVVCYNAQGDLKERCHYKEDLKQGRAEGFWTQNQPMFLEEYEAGSLRSASYYDKEGKEVCCVTEGMGTQAIFTGNQLHSLAEIQNGKAQGNVKIFYSNGTVQCTYFINGGKKEGEEVEYYPNQTHPKLRMFWHEDTLDGIVTTWYPTGNRESQREMSGNQKQGLSFAWYGDGQLMFVEEYDRDTLVKGSYFSKGDTQAASKVEDGSGTATLFDAHGHLLKRVLYEKGKPKE